MPIQIVEIVEDGSHRWALAVAFCKLDQKDDLLIKEIAAKVREAFGEGALIDIATSLSESADQSTFDETTLRSILREGFPNPTAEGNKPPELTGYRSQAAEIMAKVALLRAFNFKSPVSPQQASLNANQPVLGFDGWGLTEINAAEYGLLLIQVKATDENACPPSEAGKLANECKAAPKDRSKIIRALSVMAQMAKDDHVKAAVIGMLNQMTKDSLPSMTICPVIVRGIISGHHNDLTPVRSAAIDCHPAILHGLVISLGVNLADFGRRVMELARSPD